MRTSLTTVTEVEYTENVEEMTIKKNLKSLYVQLYNVKDTPNVFLSDQFESRIKGITNATQETIQAITNDRKHFFLADDWENVEFCRKHPHHRYMWDTASENEDDNEEEEE